MSQERIDRLIRMYVKYIDAGQGLQAMRTLTRIKELGGTTAVTRALEEAGYEDR